MSETGSHLNVCSGRFTPGVDVGEARSAPSSGSLHPAPVASVSTQRVKEQPVSDLVGRGGNVPAKKAPGKKAPGKKASDGFASSHFDDNDAPPRMKVPELPAPPTDPLSVLGLGEVHTEADLNRAWRRYAARHHPDRGGDALTFTRGRMAYEELLARR